MIKTAAICVAVLPLLMADCTVAVADDLPPSGRYQCTGTNGPMPELNFVVGPGNIYTTPKGFRGTMTVHPLSGNILFHDAPPQRAYQGRYAVGPLPQVSLVTVTGGTSSETGITCQVR